MANDVPAARVSVGRDGVRSRRWRTWVTWDRAVAAGWLVGLGVLGLFGAVPLVVPVVYVLMSLVAFAAYAADKAQAGLGKGRISERALHLIELAGGWPGALVAQRQFRHKTRKARFQLVFWLIVLAHVAAVGWYVTRSA
jgi:uncharacterized membrane protein YsdA (DUF1294 family)